MTRYISMLRGINVSGRRKIRMADLKLLYESIGLHNLTTYIQSGNVLFDASEKESACLAAKIEKSIAQQYGFDVPVILRTHDEMEAIVKGIPFTTVNLPADETKVIVTFMASAPSKIDIATIHKYANSAEKLVIKEKEAYLYCPNGYGKTQLSNARLEQYLKTNATSRNWKTVNKLYDLSHPQKG